jgi:ribonuclease I
MNEVEAVARAVAPMMEGGREFDQMPPTRLELRQWSRSGMCSTNDATQDDATELAQAAIAAVYAPLVESLSNDGELLTIAWMDGSHSSNTAHRARIAELEAEVERLREVLEEIMGLPGEINPINYDHDDVCELNRQFCYGYAIARAALKDTRND